MAINITGPNGAELQTTDEVIRSDTTMDVKFLCQIYGEKKGKKIINLKKYKSKELLELSLMGNQKVRDNRIKVSRKL